VKPGDIFSLPSSDPDGGDPKDDRPHVLVSLVEQDGEFATVVYCSTQSWEIGFAGPPYVVIEPSSGTFAATGLQSRTVAYPGRLAVCFVSDLTVQRGVLMDELPALQTALLRAIGFRAGVSRSVGMPASGSYRGVVVRFTAEFVDFCGVEFGLIVSEPKYSRETMFQNFVPLMHEAELADPNSHLRISVQPLLKSAPASMMAVTRMVQSCHHRFAVASTVGHVDAETMKAVEDELAVRFFCSVIVAETSEL
jgi:mRNA-degrading endonuclease toxin of MazEF toxin-antitoxin module